MRPAQVYTALVSGLLLALPALAEETPVDIDTDLDGDYFIVERSGTAQKPIVVVKNVGAGFTHYIKREFDCETNQVRYVAEGDSLEGMTETDPESKMKAASPGSISDQLRAYVCPKDAPVPAPAAK